MSLSPTKSRFRILVIDDTKTDRDLFKYFIGQAGYDVETAANGQEALQVLKTKDFDLALCDYQMPSMDGYEFLTTVKANEALKHLVVIVITSDESEPTKVKLLKGGANDFIHKGASPDEILNRIKIHLDAQAGYFNRQVLSVAGKLASELNQPLAVIVSALDVLTLKIETELPPHQQASFKDVVKSLNTQADIMMAMTENLRKLGMDTTKIYKLEKKY